MLPWLSRKSRETREWAARFFLMHWPADARGRMRLGVPGGQMVSGPRQTAWAGTIQEMRLGGSHSRRRGLDTIPRLRRRSRPPRTMRPTPENTNAADPKGSSGIALRLLRRVNVPRTPSLELYVLPNGGGQLLSRPSYTPTRHYWRVSYQMELRGIEPLTSAVRLQRSPS